MSLAGLIQPRSATPRRDLLLLGGAAFLVVAFYLGVPARDRFNIDHAAGPMIQRGIIVHGPTIEGHDIRIDIRDPVLDADGIAGMMCRDLNVSSSYRVHVWHGGAEVAHCDVN